MNLPTISSKLKYTIEYSILSGDICMFSVQEGPLFNKATYSDGFWNKVYGTAEIPSSLKGLSGGSSLRNDMGLLYYSLGLVKAPDDLFIKYSSFSEPNSNNPLTWKDPWLEQSIRESMSEIIPLDIDSIYPKFELERKENLNIIDNTSFIIESGQTIATTNSWSLSSFNLQLNFIIENGILQFDPKGADDRGNTLVPMGNKSESVFIGFLNESDKPVYGVTISSELYTEGVYAIGFYVGKIIKQFNTKITFPSSISILVQENSQIYFTVNGYHMYQGNATITDDIHVKVGATFSNNLNNKKSVLVIKEVILQ